MSPIVRLDDDALRGHLKRRSRGGAVDLGLLARRIAAAETAIVERSGPRLRTRSLMSGTGMAAVVVVAVALAGGLLDLGRDPPGKTIGPQTSIPTITDAPSAIATELVPLARWGALVWSPGDPGDSGLTIGPADAVAHGTGFLAIGRSPSPARGGRVWGTLDGRSWTAMEAPMPDVSFERIVPFDHGYLIVGSIGDVASMWRTLDGRSLTRVTLPDDLGSGRRVSSIAVNDSEILVQVVGASDVRPVHLLGSGDGAWVRIPLDPSMNATGFPITLAAGGDRWLATGQVAGRTASPDDVQGAIWTSGDGILWRPSVVEGPVTAINAIFRVRDGYVATGSDRPPCGSVMGCGGIDLSGPPLWASRDGLTWRRLAIESWMPPGGSGLISDGSRSMLIDRVRGGGLRARMSTDAFTWTELEMLHPAADADVLRDPFPGNLQRAFLGPAGVVLFQEMGFDEETPLQPWYGLAVEGARPTDATFPPPPDPVANDVVCDDPPGEPCGP